MYRVFSHCLIVFCLLFTAQAMASVAENEGQVTEQEFKADGEKLADSLQNQPLGDVSKQILPQDVVDKIVSQFSSGATKKNSGFVAARIGPHSLIITQAIIKRILGFPPKPDQPSMPQLHLMLMLCRINHHGPCIRYPIILHPCRNEPFYCYYR